MARYTDASRARSAQEAADLTRAEGNEYEALGYETYAAQMRAGAASDKAIAAKGTAEYERLADLACRAGQRAEAVADRNYLLRLAIFD